MIIKRDSYLQKLIRNMWNGDAKVITGIRGCGKSVLLFDLFHDYLISTGVPEDHILVYRLDQRKYIDYRNPILLCDTVEKIVSDKKEEKFYLFIDEVQLCPKEKTGKNGEYEVTIYDMLNELKDYPNLDVYVTGSNSKGLSSDIATEFRGRATQISVYPLSFAELYSAIGGDEKDALDIYLTHGGMPHILELETEKEKKDYLIRLYDSVYLKDIQERNHIERLDVLKKVLDYLSFQVGTSITPNNIATYINAKDEKKVNSNLISRYLSFLKDSFLVSEAKRFDIKGKRYFDYPSKYYFTDLGLRNARINFREINKGQLMENLIYNELVRRGYSVDVGVVVDRRNNKNSLKEIDFVAHDADKRMYIQSAYSIDTKEKEEAEVSSFYLTKDFFKKVLIQDDITTNYYDEQGIYHVKLVDFLLDRVKID